MLDPYKELYSYDGMNNNLQNPTWGAKDTPRLRHFPQLHGYEDDLMTPPPDLPSARRIMEDVFRVAKPRKDKHTNHLLLEFGHFMVNDIVQSAIDPNDGLPIPCDGTLNDIMFCPGTGQFFGASQFSQMNKNGTLEIPFHRMTAQEGTLPRMPLNTATSFLDLSNIYGTTEEEVIAVRGNHNSGGIDYDENNLSFSHPDVKLPYQGGMNSSPGKYAMYVLFIRYHNLRAAEHASRDPWLSSDEIFDRARMDTIAVYQNIVEEKYVPTLVGDTLDQYTGYDPKVNPSVDIFFAAVSFRYGHSAFSMDIPVIDKHFQPIVNTMLIRDVFKQNVPQLVESFGGIEPFLRGCAITTSHGVDLSIVDDLNVWSEATSVLDIQRARDSGIPPYNIIREAFNLSRVANFTDLAKGDLIMAQSLERLYDSNIDRVDAYVGTLLEEPKGALNMLGPVFTLSIKDQFSRLRDGDRLWYKSRYTPEQYESFPSLSELIKLVCRDEEMKHFPEDAFLTMNPEDIITPNNNDICSDSTSSISLIEGALQVSWTINDGDRRKINRKSALYVTLEAKESFEGEGFIGIGWESTKMNGAEIWFCTMDSKAFDNFEKSSQCDAPTLDATFDPSEENTVTSLFSCCVAPGAVHVKPQCASPGDDMYYNLRVVDSCISDEVTSLTIHVDLCNEEDESENSQHDCLLILDNDSNMEFIAAYNPESQSRPHGSSRRTSGEMDLKSGRAAALPNSATNDGVFAVHGLVLLTSWMVGAPIAIFIVRFMKHKSWRLVAHVTLMEMVGSMTFPLLASALAVIKESDKTAAHRIVGIYLTASLVLMVLAGSIRLLNLENPKLGRKLGNVVNWTALTFHRTFGYIILFLAWYNCYTGLIRIGPTDTYLEIGISGAEPLGYDFNAFGIIRKYVFWPNVAFWIVTFTIAEIRRRRMIGGPQRKKEIQAVLEGTGTIWETQMPDDAESMTMETFLQLTGRGTELCIIDGHVLDIGTFRDEHPGGREVLRFAQGCDITEEIFGEKDIGGTRHRHSPFAFRRMEKLIIARLETSTVQDQPSENAFGGKSIRKSFVNNDEIFHHARILGMRFLTPGTANGDNAAIWMKLEVDLHSDEESQTTSKQEVLFPSSAFTFRGWDDRDLPFERQYTPIILNTPFTQSPTSLVSNGKHSIKKQSNVYDFIISLVPNGAMSEFLKRKKQDKLLLVQGPKVNPRCIEKINSNEWRNIVLIASGTGIAPMLILVDYFIDLFEKAKEQVDAETSDYMWKGPQLSLLWVLKSPKHNYAETLDLEGRVKRSNGFFRWIVLYPEKYGRQRSVFLQKMDSLRVIPDTYNTIRSKLKIAKIRMIKNGKFNMNDIIEISQISNTMSDVHPLHAIKKHQGKGCNFWSDSGKCISRRIDERLFQDIFSSCKNLPAVSEGDSEEITKTSENLFRDTFVAVSGSPSFDNMVLEQFDNLGFKENQILTFYGAQTPVSSLSTNSDFNKMRAQPTNTFTSDYHLHPDKYMSQNEMDVQHEEFNVEKEKEVQDEMEETISLLPVTRPTVVESSTDGFLCVGTVDTPPGHGERLEIVVGYPRYQRKISDGSRTTSTSATTTQPYGIPNIC